MNTSLSSISPQLEALERLSHYPDYLDDPQGLELFRSLVLAQPDRHDMAPVNFNSLARLLDTIERLKATLSPPQPIEEDVERLQKLVDAYRLLAVNEGWSHRLAEAYGFKEYARSRIEEVDAKASRTIISGYDAGGYLRDHGPAISSMQGHGKGR